MLRGGFMFRTAKGLLIYKSIWLGFATFCAIAAICIGVDSYISMGEFSFFEVGMCCVLPLIPTLVKWVVNMTRSGAREGSRYKTVTFTDTHAYITDDSFESGWFSMLISIILSIVFAPIVLLIHMIKAIILIVRLSKILKSGN